MDSHATLDDHGNLYIVRIPPSGEPERTLMVFAPGAWDSFELILNVVSDTNPGPDAP